MPSSVTAIVVWPVRSRSASTSRRVWSGRTLESLATKPALNRLTRATISAWASTGCEQKTKEMPPCRARATAMASSDTACMMAEANGTLSRMAGSVPFANRTSGVRQADRVGSAVAARQVRHQQVFAEGAGGLVEVERHPILRGGPGRGTRSTAGTRRRTARPWRADSALEADHAAALEREDRRLLAAREQQRQRGARGTGGVRPRRSTASRRTAWRTAGPGPWESRPAADRIVQVAGLRRSPPRSGGPWPCRCAAPRQASMRAGRRPSRAPGVAQCPSARAVGQASTDDSTASACCTRYSLMAGRVANEETYGKGGGTRETGTCATQEKRTPPCGGVPCRSESRELVGDRHADRENARIKGRAGQRRRSTRRRRRWERLRTGRSSHGRRPSGTPRCQQRWLHHRR